MRALDTMNDTAEELVGKGTEAAGEATDDPGPEADGQTDRASGNVEQTGERRSRTSSSSTPRA